MTAGFAIPLLAFRPAIPSAQRLGEIAPWSNLVIGLITAAAVGVQPKGSTG